MQDTYTLPPIITGRRTGHNTHHNNFRSDILTLIGHVTGWINVVTQYNADPGGSSDSTTAIQNALNAAPSGATVYLQTGTYKLTGPLTIPTGVTLLGDSAWPSPSQDAGTVLVLASSFSGSQAILFTSTSGTVDGGRLSNISIDGSAASGSINGIDGVGSVKNVILQDVFIYKVPGSGIDATKTNGSGYPYGWHVNHVKIDTPGLHGVIAGGNHTDGQWYDVHAIGSIAGHAWYINGAASNTRFVSCRGEWAGTGFDGFHISGSWNTGNGAGGCSFVGCSTDRNDNHGVNVLATGTSPIIFSACMFRRDGRNAGSGGGNFAGFNYASPATIPVIADSITVYPGVDDTGSGTNSPQIGLQVVTSATSTVNIDSGYIHGATTGISGVTTGGGEFNVGPTLISASGTTGSPTQHLTPFVAQFNAANMSLSTGRDTLPILSVINTHTAPTTATVQLTGNAAGDKLLGMQVAGDTNERLAVDTNGKITAGSGSGATDVNLYRDSAGVWKTDNSLKIASNLEVDGTTTGISGQLLKAPTSYAPSITSLTTTSATLAAVSSTNVNTGSFVAPASGSVVVKASFVASESGGGNNMSFALAAHGTVTPVIGNVVTFKDNAATAQRTYIVEFLVTGLTPTTSYNFDLLFAIAAAATLTISALGTTSTTPTGQVGAPVNMSVFAV